MTKLTISDVTESDIIEKMKIGCWFKSSDSQCRDNLYLKTAIGYVNVTSGAHFDWSDWDWDKRIIPCIEVEITINCYQEEIQ